MIWICYQEIDSQFDISTIIRPFQVWDSNNDQNLLSMTKHFCVCFLKMEFLEQNFHFQSMRKTETNY